MENFSKLRNFGERRLERACAHVNDLWFPPNPALLTKIRNGLSDGKYDLNVKALVQEIKSDFALFTYCLRELVRMLTEENIPTATTSNPLELLETAGIEKLRSLLEVHEGQISRHSLKAVTPAQAARLQEAMVSASAAEVLAPAFSVDPGAGFSTALLRQIGYTLIAWNYPAVYEKAVASMKQGVDLDLAISHSLGFSPSMLALSLFNKWQLPKSMSMSSVTHSGSDEEAATGIQLTLSKICRLGETLARANNPECYPTARSDWGHARSELEKHLGPDAIRRIADRVQENCISYITLAPHLFKATQLLDPDGNLRRHRRREIDGRNPYVRQCRPFLKDKLNSFYEKLEESPSPRDDVLQLVKKIVPAAGFSGGCIFTIDPTTQTLMPQLEFGTLTARAAEIINYSVDGPESDCVLNAFRSGSPVIDYLPAAGDIWITTLSSALGRSQRMGVVYFEMPQIIFSDAENRHTTHFKAICQALNDCLKLR